MRHTPLIHDKTAAENGPESPRAGQTRSAGGIGMRALLRAGGKEG
jgi:hypothetical protein